MIVTLEEMKQYLRVDFEDDDQLIADLIYSSISLCKDVLRTDDDEVLALAGRQNNKLSVGGGYAATDTIPFYITIFNMKKHNLYRWFW